jgi:hypothetical protein
MTRASAWLIALAVMPAAIGVRSDAQQPAPQAWCAFNGTW